MEFKKISNWDFRWKFVEGGDQMTMGSVFNFLSFSKDGLLGIDWETETGKTGRYIINQETLELMDKEVQFENAYPSNIKEKLKDHPKISVNIQGDRFSKKGDKIKYVLKWESMEKTMGGTLQT